MWVMRRLPAGYRIPLKLHLLRSFLRLYDLSWLHERLTDRSPSPVFYLYNDPTPIFSYVLDRIDCISTSALLSLEDANHHLRVKIHGWRQQPITTFRHCNPPVPEVFPSGFSSEHEGFRLRNIETMSLLDMLE